MDLALMLSALLLGLSGAPHCAAMCGAACAAASGRPGGHGAWAFQCGRWLAYTAAGAVAASSVGLLAAAGQAVGSLRPLWTMLHVAALGLGLWLACRGRQPAWLERLGRPGGRGAPGPDSRGQGGWQRIQGPVRSGAIGLAWVAWPCGLLQSALLIAALANSAISGALVMGGFAAASSIGLLAGPALWARLAGGATAGGRLAGGGLATRAASASSMAVRLGGLVLAAASAWALGHGMWLRLAAWCAS